MAKVWRYTVSGTMPASSEVWSFNVHYQTDVPIATSEPSAKTVNDKIDEHFSSSGTDLAYITNCLGSGGKVTKTQVYEEVDPGSSDPPAGNVNVYNLSGNGLGSSSDVAPQALCAYISLFTGKLGRSFRGGFHAPPISNPSVLNAAGKWDPAAAYFLDWGALGAKVVDALEDVFSTTGDINPGIYSRTRRRRGQSDWFNELTTYLVRTDPRWLRRRMITHGG